MAEVNSNVYEAQLAGKVEIAPGIAYSSMHVTSASYTADGLAASDEINLFKLPVGAVIYGMTVAYDDLGTGTTLNIGDANDEDRYMAAVDTATAPGISKEIEATGFGYIIGTNEGDELIKAKNLGAAATGTIKVACFYSI